MVSRGPWESLPERVGRLEATIEALVRENEELRQHLKNAHEAEEILRRVQRRTGGADTGPLVPMRMAAAARRHRRERPPWLSVVKGGIGAGVGWALATRLRKVATVTMAAAALTTGAVTPSVITPGSPAHAGHAPAIVRHHHQTPVPPVPQPSENKRQRGGRSERSTPTAAPSHSGGPASGGASPTPMPTVSPTPQVSPTPSPSPSVPPCVPVVDEECDPDSSGPLFLSLAA